MTKSAPTCANDTVPPDHSSHNDTGLEKISFPNAACAMPKHPDEARRRAEAYLDGRRDIIDDLGSGTDGWVFSLEPYSVLKVYADPLKYKNELRVYLRLQAKNVDFFHGVNIPRLRHYHHDLLVIEISFVRPPYLIDFGKSYLDTAVDFPSEAVAMWRHEVLARFGRRRGLDALHLHARLIAELGIYHDDLSRTNLDFGDPPCDDDHDDEPTDDLDDHNVTWFDDGTV